MSYFCKKYQGKHLQHCSKNPGYSRIGTQATPIPPLSGTKLYQHHPGIQALDYHR
jgi:hypothetical protein